MIPPKNTLPPKAWHQACINHYEVLMNAAKKRVKQLGKQWGKDATIDTLKNNIEHYTHSIGHHRDMLENLEQNHTLVLIKEQQALGAQLQTLEATLNDPETPYGEHVFLHQDQSEARAKLDKVNEQLKAS